MRTTVSLMTIVFLAGCHGGPAHHGGGHTAAPQPVPLTEAAIAVPIAPGKTAAWRAALEELLGPRYAEYDASRRRYGLTAQTTFLQATPMGDFALIHLRGADVRGSFHAMSSSQDPWDVEWRAMTLDLHGLDFADGTQATPEIEPAWSMTSDDLAGARPFMFLAPLGPDGVAGVRALAAELMGPRHDAYVAARRRLGVRREVAFLESTARGDAVVFYWLADDPQASLAALASSPEPFDAWLRAAAGRAHPLPLATIATIAAGHTLIAQYPHAPDGP
jgi:hypothetical protein